MNTTEQIKATRMAIDTQTNSIKLLAPSPEITICFRCLGWAKMWLGKALGELGNPTPYPLSENSESPVIEKQAEHSSDWTYEEAWKDKNILGNQIAMVKQLRFIIQSTIETFDDFAEVSLDDIKKAYMYSICIEQARIEIIKAKMILGMELNRILETAGPLH